MTTPPTARAWTGAIVLLLLVPLGTAHAQFTNYLRPGASFTSAYAGQADITLSTMQRQSQMISYVNSVKASMARTAPGAAGTATAATGQGAAPTGAVPRLLPQPVSAADFTPTGPRNTAESIAAALAKAANREQMVQVCRQIHSTIEATPGFRKNNLAAAMTLLLGISLQVMTGRELDDRQTEALLQLVGDDIAGSGAYARLTHEQRTRTYDAMVITGGLIAGIAHNAAETGDKAQARQARAMARDALATLGLAP